MTKQPLRGSATPRATYRVQFNRHFTFSDAERLVPYLAALGISDLYASPYLRARPGSLHGYDISNHHELNPEIGSAEEHAALSRSLAEHGMGQLLDIVPNHMGIAEAGNRWWMDVLENGPSSPFARFFDIEWQPLKRELAGKVLLPVLGDQFGAVLERGELRLAYEAGRFRIEYFEHRFPVAPKSSAAVLREAARLLAMKLASDDPYLMELESIVTALDHLPPRDRTDPDSVAERRREKTVTRRRLAALTRGFDPAREAIEQAVVLFNGAFGEPRSFDRLELLLDDQAYRLAFWRVAAEEINYRRFFDINDLAGVRVERPEVFQETHALILALVAERKLTGLRIDHPDGLYDPAGYLRRLQREARAAADDEHFYVLVEKILTADEELPEDWPVAGTVGYDMMDRLNRLFVAGENEAAVDRAYQRFVPRRPEFGELIYEKKRLILRSSLSSELNTLAHLLNRISERNRRSRDFTLGSLTEALREIIACFPIYRTYVDAHLGRVSDRDRAYIETAAGAAAQRNRSTSASVFEFVRDVLLLRWPDSLQDEDRAEHAEFVMKFQQLTGPVMAKGVEDTSFYIFNRLVSLNEVGGQPDRFGLLLAAFHAYVAGRARRWPHAMNATSTHDTKRSEDVRARIHVISEIPELWEDRVAAWTKLNAHHRAAEHGRAIPDPNDEYLLYETLLGVWPLEPLQHEAHAAFSQRVQIYMEKATREAKLHTSWINPNEIYDAGIREFVRRVLDRGENAEFLADFGAFHEERIAVPGMLNALAQTLLKLTLPGVPDVYQGQEIWDFSLVDPDNRRRVDHERRREMLERLLGRLSGRDRAALAQELLRDWRDGRIKMYVTHLALLLRREQPELFAAGEYLPLETEGARALHVVAFARSRGERIVVVAVPRLPATLGAGGATPRTVWADTTLAGSVPAGRYRNVFTGELVTPAAEAGARLSAAELFRSFPLALLERLG